MYIRTCFCSQVYKEKLRELKRARRSLRKRVEEAEKRPKLINHLKESINISVGFVLQMRNISSDLNIFTEVEINTLETLVNESMVGMWCNVTACKTCFFCG